MLNSICRFYGPYFVCKIVQHFDYLDLVRYSPVELMSGFTVADPTTEILCGSQVSSIIESHNITFTGVYVSPDNPVSMSDMSCTAGEGLSHEEYPVPRNAISHEKLHSEGLAFHCPISNLYLLSFLQSSMFRIFMVSHQEQGY